MDDGGDVEVVKVEDGVVSLRLQVSDGLPDCRYLPAGRITSCEPNVALVWLVQGIKNKGFESLQPLYILQQVY